jgi:hypothetical protein
MSRAVICSWPSPAQGFLVPGPIGTHGHICVLSKTFTCFEMEPPPRQAKVFHYCWSLPLYWGWRDCTHTNTHSPANCCWPSPAQSILVSGPIGTRDHIFVLSRLLCVLKWGLLFAERRGLTTTVHSPSTGEWLLDLTLSLTHSLSLPLSATTNSLTNWLGDKHKHTPFFLAKSHRKHRFQHFLYCCVLIRCCGNMFTVPLLSNDFLFLLNYSGLQP